MKQLPMEEEAELGYSARRGRRMMEKGHGVSFGDSEGKRGLREDMSCAWRGVGRGGWSRGVEKLAGTQLYFVYKKISFFLLSLNLIN